jgi:outer membrane protein assembly factor BamB
MPRKALLLLAILCCCATPAAALPAPGTLLWKLRIGGQIWSPPIIDAGTLYVGDDEGRLSAIDLTRHAAKWTFRTQGKVRSRPAISGNKVYFASDDGYLHALDAGTGIEAWRFDLKARDLGRRAPSPDTPFYDFLQSAPLIEGGRVYVGSLSGTLFAIDARNGAKLWSVGTLDAVRGNPVSDGTSLYFGSWDRHVYAVDLATGRVRWRSDAGGIVQSTPALVDGKVVVGSRGAALTAFAADSGATAWRHAYTDGSWVESSPVAVDRMLYVGSSDALKISAIDATNGTEVWSFRTKGWTWSTPVLRNGAVYVGALSASPYYFEGVTLVPGFYALDAATGAKRWQFVPGPAEGYITGGVAVAPAIADGVVYVGAVDGYLYALKE